MIGLALHLGACALDRVVAEVEEARRVLDWCLAFTTPSLEEQVERLGAECDALRAERDKARCLVEAWQGEAEAIGREREGLKHKLWEAEAKIESLQEQVARWDRRYLEADRGNAASEAKLAADLEALRAAVRRHLAADTLDQAEPAWRALEALLPEVKP